MFAVVLLLTSLSFLLQTTKKVFAESGYLSTTIENTVAHFQDGSVLFRATQTKPTFQPVTMQIFDPKANVRVFVDDITRSVTTVTLPHAIYADMQSQLSFEGCPSQVDLAKLPDGGRILGLETKYFIQKNRERDG